MAENLTAFLEGHYFESYRTSRNGLTVNHARCQCGKKLPWKERYENHTAHVVNVLRRAAWALGYQQGKQGGSSINPYAEN